MIVLMIQTVTKTLGGALVTNTVTDKSFSLGLIDYPGLTWFSDQVLICSWVDSVLWSFRFCTEIPMFAGKHSIFPFGNNLLSLSAYTVVKSVQVGTQAITAYLFQGCNCEGQ